MVKTFLAIFLAIPLFAYTLDDIVEGLVGQKVYSSQKNRMKAMFLDKNRFYNSSTHELDFHEIVKTLKLNGLLPTSFKEAKALDITFIVPGEPILALRAINTSLELMGYSFYLSKKMLVNDKEVQWQLSLTSQYLLDPSFLDIQLRKSGYKVKFVNNENMTNWTYHLEVISPKLITDNFPLDKLVSTPKPLRAYVLDVKDVSHIEISTHPSDRWFPQIIFLDENLQLIEEIRMDTSKKNMKLNIDNLSKYLIIEDRYTLENIKYGLKFYIHSR